MFARAALGAAAATGAFVAKPALSNTMNPPKPMTGSVRVVSISPLAVDTPQLRESLAFFKITPQQAAANNPNKRINTTDEMARAVMFLASDDATSLGGMDLDVTGGWLAK